jgi:ketosteroid isomerase-like protein
VEIEGNGNTAYTRGTYEITLMPPGAKTPSKASGKFIEIRKKQADGSWLLLRDFWNPNPAAGH